MIPVKSMKTDRSAMDGIIMMGVAILVVCFIIVISLAVMDVLQASPEAVPEADIGDTVEVDYIGIYSNGWLFDTSNYTIASGDEYTKAFEFTLNDESDYSPLEFTIGDGTLLSGFNDAVIGMRAGETTTVTIPMAYGEVSEDDLFTYDLNQSVDVFEEMNLSEFESFYGEAPYEGLTVQHPIYGWDVCVFHLDSSAGTVMVENAPSVDVRYPAYGDPSAESSTGWYINVTAINSTSISFENLLSPSMAHNVMGTDESGDTFYLYAVDDEGFTLSYGSEVLGRNLTFIITLVSIA